MTNYLERFLEVRGYTQERLDNMLNPQNVFVKDTKELCEHLKACYDNNDKIVFVPDYDTDGIMSGLIGRSFFEELGFNYVFYPSDVRLGYGLDKRLVDNILEEHSDAKYLLTADLGINDFEQIARLESEGIRVLVTDHHKPDCYDFTATVVVNPMLDDRVFSGSCGAYTLWQTLNYFIKVYFKDDKVKQGLIKDLMIFAGIGNISDTMPFYHNNRMTVDRFLGVVKQYYEVENDFYIGSQLDTSLYCDYVQCIFENFYVLLDYYKSKFSYGKEVTSDLVGFYIAPLLNTVKRLSGDIALVYKFFETGEGLDELLRNNAYRKKIVDELFEDLVSQGERGYLPYFPYVVEVDTINGLCGLLAMKLMQKYNVPCVVLTSKGHGSGRYPGVASKVDLSFQKDYQGIKARGHALAFGASGDAKTWYMFLKELDKRSEAYKGQIGYDLELNIGKDFNLIDFVRFLSSLEIYKPFGKGFEAPYFKVVVPKYYGKLKRFGKDDAHIKLSFNNGMMEIIHFFAKERQDVYYGRFEFTDFGLRLVV